jgi:hypothetical protein
LILQLINGKEEYAKFEHSQETFYNFEKVQKEIVDETEREVGNSKGVSRSPIVLKVCSPNGKKMML